MSQHAGPRITARRQAFHSLRRFLFCGPHIAISALCHNAAAFAFCYADLARRPSHLLAFSFIDRFHTA